jgi:hypothetical protein
MPTPSRRAQFYAAQRQVVIAKQAMLAIVEVVQAQKLSVEDGLRVTQAQRRAHRAFDAALDMLQADGCAEDKV